MDVGRGREPVLSLGGRRPSFAGNLPASWSVLEHGGANPAHPAALPPPTCLRRRQKVSSSLAPRRALSWLRLGPVPPALRPHRANRRLEGSPPQGSPDRAQMPSPPPSPSPQPPRGYRLREKFQLRPNGVRPRAERPGKVGSSVCWSRKHARRLLRGRTRDDLTGREPPRVPPSPEVETPEDPVVSQRLSQAPSPA